MVTVERDPDDMPPDIRAIKEPCAVCFKGCTTWFAPRDVAVCLSCAETVSPDEIPNKKDWCDQVRARERRTGRVYA